MTGSIEDLTDGQRQCLRLLYGRLSAKEIAAELGISPDTVNQRLAAARRKLGVSRSIEAARILAAAEGAPIYKQTVYQQIDIEDEAPAELRSAASRLPWPVPTKWRRKNDLSIAERLVAIVGIAVLFMGVVGFYFLTLKLFNDSF